MSMLAVIGPASLQIMQERPVRYSWMHRLPKLRLTVYRRYMVLPGYPSSSLPQRLAYRHD
jgi:hypothetical protein